MSEKKRKEINEKLDELEKQTLELRKEYYEIKGNKTIFAEDLKLIKEEDK